MKKFGVAAVLALALIFGVLNYQVHAEDFGKSKGHKFNLEDKFNYKVRFLMMKQDELGLSDKQMDKIEAIAFSAKKDVIKIQAEIDILALEIKAGLHKDSVDAGRVYKFFEKKYEFKKRKAKVLVQAYADLKKNLTSAQKAKMKEIFKAKMKERPMLRGKMGSFSHKDNNKCGAGRD